jgi:hypothetical protein
VPDIVAEIELDIAPGVPEMKMKVVGSLAGKHQRDEVSLLLRFLLVKPSFVLELR